MELKVLTDKAVNLLRKHKYVILIVAVGILLMTLPGNNDRAELEKPSISLNSDEKESIEERLKGILSKIRGAGDVEVMLTTATGEEVIFQTDDDYTNGENTSSTRMNTVTVTDAQRNQDGLVRQVNPPVYMGAVIICQGGDDPAVRLSIVDAVSKLTGLGANRISVLKMK